LKTETSKEFIYLDDDFSNLNVERHGEHEQNRLGNVFRVQAWSLVEDFLAILVVSCIQDVSFGQPWADAGESNFVVFEQKKFLPHDFGGCSDCVLGS
jgi:hypothetical protein